MENVSLNKIDADHQALMHFIGKRVELCHEIHEISNIWSCHKIKWNINK